MPTLLQSLRRHRSAIAMLQSAALAVFACQAHAGNTWDGGGGDNNWGTAANWSPDGAPGYGTLTFSGTSRTSNINNSITAMNQVNWTGTAAWSMTGSATLSLFDNGGTQAKLEANTSGGVTINAPIVFAANNGAPPNPYGEINAINSNISFTGSTLTVNGSSVNGIKFWGGNGRDVSFGNTVSATGKWFALTNTTSQSVTIASGGNVTSNDWYVMNGGTLKLAGGTLTTTAVRLGGDFGNTGNQNQTLGGTLALTPTTGGVSFGSTINTVSGNTSNALLIDSQNTSGTNTLTSGIFLDSDLKIQQAAGGTLSTSTGSFDVKARKLTVDSAGSVTIGQALTSSLGAGGSLVKQGAGTLTLSSTSNTYTGTSSGTLNANGTQIAAGTLAIAGDTSLGLAPAGAYNNIQFTGSGTLRANASISLNANRDISVASGQTATLDNNGNTFTINGIVNGTGGNLASAGSGTTILTGTNTYDGTTTISSGTLQVGNGGSTGSLGSGAVTNNGTLAFNRASGGNFVLSNGISGTGSLQQNGGNIITMSVANSYSGATTINSGILRVTANDALGTSAAGTTVNSGGQLRLANASYTTAEALTINGAGGDGNGALYNVTGTSSYAGDITAATNATISTVGGGTLTLNGGLIKNGTTLTLSGPGSGFIVVNGIISGSNANSDLVVSGTSVTLNASSTYNGPTFIRNGGTLVANTANALPTSPRSAVTLDDSGSGSSTLSINASSQIASLSGAASSTMNSLVGATTTIGTSSGTTTFNGTLGLTGPLVKDGASTQVLTGSSLSSGSTTVSAGVLELNNTTGSATGSGAVSVSSGATLSGTGGIATGSTNGVIVNGNLVVGSTIGAATVADFEIDTTGGSGSTVFSGATLKFDLFSGAGSGTLNGSSAADKLLIGGALSLLSSVVLDVANPNGMSLWSVGDAWDLWNVTSTITGTIATINAPTLGTGKAWSFSESTGVLSIVSTVPEPSRALFLLLGCTAFGLRRRRK